MQVPHIGTGLAFAFPGLSCWFHLKGLPRTGPVADKWLGPAGLTCLSVGSRHCRDHKQPQEGKGEELHRSRGLFEYQAG